MLKKVCRKIISLLIILAYSFSFASPAAAGGARGVFVGNKDLEGLKGARFAKEKLHIQRARMLEAAEVKRAAEAERQKRLQRAREALQENIAQQEAMRKSRIKEAGAARRKLLRKMDKKLEELNLKAASDREKKLEQIKEERIEKAIERESTAKMWARKSDRKRLAGKGETMKELQAQAQRFAESTRIHALKMRGFTPEIDAMIEDAEMLFNEKRYEQAFRRFQEVKIRGLVLMFQEKKKELAKLKKELDFKREALTRSILETQARMLAKDMRSYASKRVKIHPSVETIYNEAEELFKNGKFKNAFRKYLQADTMALEILVKREERRLTEKETNITEEIRKHQSDEQARLTGENLLLEMELEMLKEENRQLQMRTGSFSQRIAQEYIEEVGAALESISDIVPKDGYDLSADTRRTVAKPEPAKGYKYRSDPKDIEAMLRKREEHWKTKSEQEKELELKALAARLSAEEKMRASAREAEMEKQFQAILSAREEEWRRSTKEHIDTALELQASDLVAKKEGETKAEIEKRTTELQQKLQDMLSTKEEEWKEQAREEMKEAVKSQAKWFEDNYRAELEKKGSEWDEYTRQAVKKALRIQAREFASREQRDAVVREEVSSDVISNMQEELDRKDREWKEKALRLLKEQAARFEQDEKRWALKMEGDWKERTDRKVQEALENEARIRSAEEKAARRSKKLAEEKGGALDELAELEAYQEEMRRALEAQAARLAEEEKVRLAVKEAQWKKRAHEEMKLALQAQTAKLEEEKRAAGLGKFNLESVEDLDGTIKEKRKAMDRLQSQLDSLELKLMFKEKREAREKKIKQQEEVIRSITDADTGTPIDGTISLD